jgi:hypothetical protein
MGDRLSEAHEELIRYGLSFPSTREDRPWGERVVKVRKKIFVFFGRFRPEDERLSLSVKLPESAARALDTGFAEPTGYGMGKHGWVTASFGPGDLPSIDVLKAWIAESYRAVAPKRLAAKREKQERAGEASAEPVVQPMAAKQVAAKKKATKKKVAVKKVTAKKVAKKPATKPKARAKPVAVKARTKKKTARRAK